MQVDMQDDFNGLTVPDLQHDGYCLHMLVDRAIVSGSSSGSAKSGKCAWGDSAMQTYTKNEMREVRPTIDKVTLHHSTVAQESDAIEMVSEQASIDFEPCRRLRDSAPPTRFYRQAKRSL
jgi:hypothetical protein